MHGKIRDAWGLEAQQHRARLKTQLVSGGLNTDNFGSLTRALAQQYPATAGYTTFQRDGCTPCSYSHFNDGIRNAPNDKARFDVVNGMWMKDVNQWTTDMKDLPNGLLRGLARSGRHVDTMTVMDFHR